MDRKTKGTGNQGPSGSKKQSSASPRRVWFQLVGSVDGKPYKGTTPSSVSLPSDSLVVQFRDAVKAENSNKLSTIDAADLLLYKNKAAFDKRIAIADDVIVNDGDRDKLSQDVDALHRRYLQLSVYAAKAARSE